MRVELKIVNEPDKNGIHIWGDGTIHLDKKKWNVHPASNASSVHIFKKERMKK